MIEKFETDLLDIKNHLLSFARGLTKNEEEAKDLVQETFLKVLSSKDKFREGSNIKAWSFTIMRNLFINDYRKKQLLSFKEDFTEKGDQIEVKTKDFIIQPDEEYFAKEIIQEINKLSLNINKAFIMYISGYHYEEISDILEVKMGTIKSRIHFARKKLKVKLKE